MIGEPPEGSAESFFETLGISIVVPPGVMPITRATDLLASAVLKNITESDRVLDFGTRSGVNAVLAARQSPNVIAVDLVPSAVAAARSNAVRNQVADRVTVLRSNGFSAVKGRFDVIIVDAAGVDDRTLQEFFADLSDHLADQGRVLLHTDKADDLGELLELITQHGLERTTVAQRTINRGERWDPHVVFRLVRSGSGTAAAIEQASE